MTDTKIMGERKRMRPPAKCYEDFGADLDGCSGQQDGGCQDCICLEEETPDEFQLFLQEIKHNRDYYSRAKIIEMIDEKYEELGCKVEHTQEH